MLDPDPQQNDRIQICVESSDSPNSLSELQDLFFFLIRYRYHIGTVPFTREDIRLRRRPPLLECSLCVSAAIKGAPFSVAFFYMRL